MPFKFRSLEPKGVVLVEPVAFGDDARASEQGLMWSDPAIGIGWPIKTPILSDKDKKWPNLADAQYFS